MEQREIIVEHKYIDNEYYHCFDDKNFELLMLERKVYTNENERLNKTLEDIDTYIHLWNLEEIGEKTMLILNDILLIKNGMRDEVVRLKDSGKDT